MEDLKAAAIKCYDDFTHTHLDRRRFFADLTKLAGSAAAAQALVLAAILAVLVTVYLKLFGRSEEAA